MRISLIGMSGSGKSHWSAVLADSGFRRYCCDDLITGKLSSELIRDDGTALTLGEWMGFPFQSGYRDREERYLSREREVFSEVLDQLEAQARAGSRENVVVDTTGSVIYTGKALLERLKTNTIVIHFSSPPEAREEMLGEYMARPRPVLWRGLFDAKPGEGDKEALSRCYRILLETRERLYRELADIEIDFETRRSQDFTISNFLAIAGSRK